MTNVSLSLAFSSARKKPCASHQSYQAASTTAGSYSFSIGWLISVRRHKIRSKVVAIRGTMEVVGTLLLALGCGVVVLLPQTYFLFLGFLHPPTWLDETRRGRYSCDLPQGLRLDVPCHSWPFPSSPRRRGPWPCSWVVAGSSCFPWRGPGGGSARVTGETTEKRRNEQRKRQGNLFPPRNPRNYPEQKSVYLLSNAKSKPSR